MQGFDSIEWVYSKENFSLAKKHKYDQTITKQKQMLVPFTSPFIARVKSNEVYYVDDITLDEMFHILTAERPRLITAPTVDT